MIIQQINSTNTNFTASSAAKTKADDICRRVIREFPIIYSNTKLNKFRILDDTRNYVGYENYSNKLLSEYRRHYLKFDEIDKQLQSEITGMKKHKVGNCAELADAANIALKLNGYEDVKILNLFAYNSKTKRMRDLNHTVAGINFKVPKNYEYCTYIKYTGDIDPKYRIYPKNNSIVVDVWSGFSEYGKKVSERYNTSRALIKGQMVHSPVVKSGETLLKADEKLCFVPVYEDSYINNGLLPMFKQEYPNLVLSDSKSVSDPKVTGKLIKFDGLADSDIQGYKIRYGISSAVPEKKNEIASGKNKNKLASRCSDMLKKVRGIFL